MQNSQQSNKAMCFELATRSVTSPDSENVCTSRASRQFNLRNLGPTISKVYIFWKKISWGIQISPVCCYAWLMLFICYDASYRRTLLSLLSRARWINSLQSLPLVSGCFPVYWRGGSLDSDPRPTQSCLTHPVPRNRFREILLISFGIRSSTWLSLWRRQVFLLDWLVPDMRKYVPCANA